MRLLEIRRYPVKSMLGEMPGVARVERGGLVGDRAHAVRDVETGKIASAKNPRLWARLFRMAARYDGPPGPGQRVEVALPGGHVVHSAQPDFHDRISAVVERQVQVVAGPVPEARYEYEWPDVAGTVPDNALASARTWTTVEGRTLSSMAMGIIAPGTFQDVAPVSIITTATLRRAVELQPASRWDPRRFRANFVIDVDGAFFVENDWVDKKLRVGDVVLDIRMPTPRCVMTTLPQADLPADREILRGVARHNRIDVGETGLYACLGAYAVVLEPGCVTTGDEVELG